ncbi:hypothetical protein CDCA_CDCA17G4352 [Cyanidium caldarium]|uniref:Uncharacterized protein n=1 Tax=Cyanidium caldarium TaxID=2771 RepID=A0AAV9J179_CYACA|nr:hypothetical protein CDCA_CDCA17G4352 [Cyanidium caldarium]
MFVTSVTFSHRAAARPSSCTSRQLAWSGRRVRLARRCALWATAMDGGDAKAVEKKAEPKLSEAEVRAKVGQLKLQIHQVHRSLQVAESSRESDPADMWRSAAAEFSGVQLGQEKTAATGGRAANGGDADALRAQLDALKRELGKLDATALQDVLRATEGMKTQQDLVAEHETKTQRATNKSFQKVVKQDMDAPGKAPPKKKPAKGNIFQRAMGWVYRNEATLDEIEREIESI